MTDSEQKSPFPDDILLREAWSWMEDCGIVSEDDTQLALDGDVTSAQIISNMNKHYSGGWEEFKRDAAFLEEWYVSETITSPRGMKVIVERSNFGNTRSRLVGN